MSLLFLIALYMCLIVFHNMEIFIGVNMCVNVQSVKHIPCHYITDGLNKSSYSLKSQRDRLSFVPNYMCIIVFHNMEIFYGVNVQSVKHIPWHVLIMTGS